MALQHFGDGKPANGGGARHANAAHGAKDSGASHAGDGQSTRQAIQPYVEQVIKLAPYARSGPDSAHQNEDRNADNQVAPQAKLQYQRNDVQRSEGRRVGKRGESTCKSGGGARKKKK